MAVNVHKLQQMFPLVDEETIKEIVAKNPGQKIYTEAIPQLKLIQEYKESLDPQLQSIASAPSGAYEADAFTEHEGVAPAMVIQSQPFQPNNDDNAYSEVMLTTKNEPAGRNYNAIDSNHGSAAGDVVYELYSDLPCCPPCCGDPRKPAEPHWSFDCRQCCQCCFMLPDESNYDGSKIAQRGGFMFEKDVKVFMYAFLVLIVMSMPGEYAYEIDASHGDGRSLFLAPCALILAFIAILCYFLKKVRHFMISGLFLIAAMLYACSYVWRATYVQDFLPDCSNWAANNSCDSDSWWWWDDDYCRACVCHDDCGSCTAGEFDPNYDGCFHLEKSYVASRGIYIAMVMLLLAVHFSGRRCLSSRTEYLKFHTLLLIFYSVCVGAVTANNYYYQIVFSGCPSLLLAMLLLILFCVILNGRAKVRGGCNGTVSMGVFLWIFLIWNFIVELVCTAVLVAQWGDDKGVWLFFWQFSVAIFGFFNFFVMFRALHPCMICKTCYC